MKRIMYVPILLLSIFFSCTTVEESSVPPGPINTNWIFEAESGLLSEGLQSTATYIEGFSNGATIEFSVDVPISIQCYLTVNAVSEDSQTGAIDILVNKIRMGTVTIENEEKWIPSEKSKFRLNPGLNTIVLKAKEGVTSVDSIHIWDVNDPSEYYKITGSLVTEDPMENSQHLYEYLKSIYGNHTLTGQQDLTWNDSVNMYKRVQNDTGKLPAIMGFDFLNIQGTGSGATQTDEAINWWINGGGTGKHGIVTYCWHWRSPLDKHAGSGFYTEKTSYRIPYDTTTDQWKTETEEYQEMMNDIEFIANELKMLQSMGVPVLWRPLHEASGGWFWWGATGSEPYIALWNLLYDQLNNVYGLKNLIWVWNGQDKFWYPGDETVDIVGYDLYAKPASSMSGQSEFMEMIKIPGENKLTAMSENGVIPDPDLMLAQKVFWLYFVTWNDATPQEGLNKDNNFWTGENNNPQAHKEKVYSHDIMITLDELPDLTTFGDE